MMKFEPGSFYLGVVDFFSIMLPGGLLAFFLNHKIGSDVFGPLLPAIPGDVPGATWIVFLFAAYLFGHIVFLGGSYLDLLYDPVRKVIWPKEKDLAYAQADALKRKALGADMAKAINTFQWAKAVLTLDHPAAIAEIARLEADSKFFRSLLVVLVVLFLFLLGSKVTEVVRMLMVVLIALAYARYIERRHKSTEQAYRYMIVLMGQRKRVK